METTKFTIYSGLLKAYEKDGKKHFRTTASSSVKDLHGDTIHLSALERMQRDAVGMTLFLNHSYNVPEDLMGTAMDAQLMQRGADGDGNPIYDLDIEGVVDETNPRAVQTWDAINSGVKLGTSIGALIPQPEGAKKNKQNGAWDIFDIQLLEASIVGIPANPRSWVQYAAKSLRSAEILESAGVVRSNAYLVGESEPETFVVLGNPLNDDGEVVESAEPDIEMAACPDCGGAKGAPKGSCSNHMHSSIEPDVADSTTVVNITVNNDDDAQGAGSSEPENASALMDEDRADVPTGEDSEPSLGDNVTESADLPFEVRTEIDPAHLERIGIKADSLAELVKALKDMLDRNDMLTTELSVMTGERDEWKKNWDEAAEIIARIENLPIGRKTAFAGAVSDFRTKFDGYYSEEFLKFMEK